MAINAELVGFDVAAMMTVAKEQPLGQQKLYYLSQIIATLGSSWVLQIRSPGRTGSVKYQAMGRAAFGVLESRYLTFPNQFEEPPSVNLAETFTDAWFVLINPNDGSVGVYIPVAVGGAAGTKLNIDKVLTGNYTVRNGGILLEAPAELDVNAPTRYALAQLTTDMTGSSEARPLIDTGVPRLATESMYGYPSPIYVAGASHIAPMFRVVPTDPRNAQAAPNSRLEIRALRLLERTSPTAWTQRMVAAAGSDLNAQLYYLSAGAPYTGRSLAPIQTSSTSVFINLDEFRHASQANLLGWLNGAFAYPTSGLKTVPYNVQFEARKVLINGDLADDRANVRIVAQALGSWRYAGTDKNLGNVAMIGDSMTAGNPGIYYSDVDYFTAHLTAGGWTHTLVGIESLGSWPGEHPVMASGGWTFATVAGKMADIVNQAPKHLVVNLGYSDIQTATSTTQLAADVTTFYNDLFNSTSGITGRVVWACIPVHVEWLDSAMYFALADAIVAWVNGGNGTNRRLIDLRRAELNLEGTTNDGAGDGTHWSEAGARKIAHVKMWDFSRHLDEIAFVSRWKVVPNNGEWMLFSATNIGVDHPYYGQLNGALTGQQLLDNPPPLIA